MNGSRSAGFTLLEAMIVLVVVGVVAAISLDMLTGQARAEARRQMVSQQATEMATIDRAVNQWVTAGTGLPTTAGQIMEISLADVATAGLLPADFARRVTSGTSSAVTPLGIRYRAFVRLSSTGGFEVVTIPIGSPNAGFAARAGLTAEAESLRTFNVAVMQEIRSQHRIPAGVVNRGASSVDPASSGFSIDLAGFLGGNAADMVVATMSNFVALETALPGGSSTGNPNDFVGKTCRPTAETCAAGEKEASAYRTCSTWGLFRQSGLPHEPIGELFVTPIGNIQITKTTNITDINSVHHQGWGQIDANPPHTIALNGNTAGAARIANYISLFDWNGTYVGYSVRCRHPDGTQWDCVPWVSSASGVNINNDNLIFAMSPMQNQIVSGALMSFGPAVSESVANREVLWAHDNFGTSGWRRTGARPVCPGSVRAVPTPVWTQDLTLNPGIVGWGGDTSGRIHGISGATPLISLGVMPAYSARFNQGNIGPGTRLTYLETTQIPGQNAITTVCEENVFSNAATVANPRTSGWAGASIGGGVNACPTSSLVARFGGANYTLRTGRAYETFQFRPSDDQQPTIRICCK